MIFHALHPNALSAVRKIGQGTGGYLTSRVRPAFRSRCRAAFKSKGFVTFVGQIQQYFFGQRSNFYQTGSIDFVPGIRGTMVIGMSPGKNLHGRYSGADEANLIAGIQLLGDHFRSHAGYVAGAHEDEGPFPCTGFV